MYFTTKCNWNQKYISVSSCIHYPGLGTCDGAAEEIAQCDNEVCPMETDKTSLVMIIGGETSVSRENEHSSSIEILGPNGLCRLEIENSITCF